MKFLKKPSVFSKRIWAAIVLGTATVLVALGLALAPANEAQAGVVEAPPAKIVVPKEATVITPVDQPTVYNTQRNETVEQPELVARTNITITSPLDVDQLTYLSGESVMDVMLKLYELHDCVVLIGEPDGIAYRTLTYVVRKTECTIVQVVETVDVVEQVQSDPTD